MISLQGASADDQGPRVLNADLDLSRVLVPLDGHPPGEHALSYASVFAKCFGSNILLFHVLPPAHPVHQVRGAPVRYPNALRDRGAILANSYLQQVAAKLQPFGINAQWSVATGNTAELISMRSVIGGFGLIVLAVNMQSRNRGRPVAKLAVEVWKRTAVPILLVDPAVSPENESPAEQPGRLLVPLHPRDRGRETLDMAEAIASRSGAPVTIVCSRPPRGETPRHIEAQVSRMLELNLAADIHISTEDIPSHARPAPGRARRFLDRDQVKNGVRILKAVQRQWHRPGCPLRPRSGTGDSSRDCRQEARREAPQTGPRGAGTRHRQVIGRRPKPGCVVLLPGRRS